MMLKNDNCGGIGIHGGLVQHDWLRVNFSISCSRTETAGENTARSVISLQVRVLLVINSLRNREKSGQRKQDRPWTVSFSSLRDRVDFYLKKILCDRLPTHEWWCTGFVTRNRVSSILTGSSIEIEILNRFGIVS